MSAEELTIAMRLRGARAANAQLRETAGAVDSITAAQLRSNRASARFARGMSAAGATMTRRFTVPVVAGMAFAVKGALDFNGKMRLLQTQAGATVGEVAKMKPAVLAFAQSGKTVFAPGQLADALFFVESHGFRGAAALRKLRASSDFAMVGHANLAATTEALTAAQASHIKGTETEVRTTRMLNALIGQGAMHMDDLTGAMGTGVLPAANQMGLGLVDVGAALDILTRKGTPAQASATRLRMTFARMIGGVPAIEKALNKIGLTGLRLGHDMRKKNGLLVAVQDLRKHLDRVKDPVKQAQVLLQAFGGGRMSGGIMGLVQNVDELERIYKKLNKQSDAYNQSVKSARNEPINKLRTALSKLEASGIKLGDALIPMAVKLAGALGSIADAFAGHPKLGLSILAAVALMGPFLSLASGVFKIYKAFVMLRTATFAETVAMWGFNSAVLANPITWVVIAVVGLIVLLVVLEKKFGLVSRAIGFLGDHWRSIIGFLSRPLVAVINHFKMILRVIKSIVNWIKKIHIPHVPGMPGFLQGSLLSKFADGGHVATRTTALVGENGPEVVSLPGGSRVHPNEGGSTATMQPIVLTVDGRTLHEAVYRVERDRVARK
jgi:TP901 family phage tail tape measure protein